MPEDRQTPNRNNRGSDNRDKLNKLVIENTNSISSWIEIEIDNNAINFAEQFGDLLCKNGLSTNQIRNPFGEVRRIQMKGDVLASKTEILLLKPKLAYAKARGNTVSAEALHQVLSKAIDSIFKDNNEAEIKKRFKNFADFFEAILAYHKAKGGK